MKKILIAEDDKNIQNIVAYNLEKEGYQVFTTETGEEALEIFNEEGDICLILMDAMMPKMNGFDCVEHIREQSDVPIIMLTALESEEDKLKGFDTGINDYVTKPFSVREVLARVKTQLRLSEMSLTGMKKGVSSNVIQINNIELNTLNNKVTIDNRTSELTNTEFKVLMFLYKNPNKVFDRKELFANGWGVLTGVNEDLRTVDVTIKRLREKVEINSSDPQNIKTKRGKGYYLELNT